jgi:hypothetical protein
MSGDQLSYEQIRSAWVRDELSATSGKEAAKYDRSEYKLALDAITRAAMQYAMSHEVSQESFEDILREAISLLSSLRVAVGADEGEDREKMRLWSHRSQPIYDIKAKKIPSLSRTLIEQTVNDYIRLPYRSSLMDRLLVDILIVMELYAYGNETINAIYIPGVFASSQVKRRPVIDWFVSNLLNLVILVLIGLGLWSLSLIHLFPKSWLDWSIIVLGALFLFGWGWSTVWLPRVWLLATKEKRKSITLLGEMNGVYMELKSAGPISARHLEYRARTAVDAGVLWPAPLFVMLDDINLRGGRF